MTSALKSGVALPSFKCERSLIVWHPSKCYSVYNYQMKSCPLKQRHMRFLRYNIVKTDY